MKGVRRRYHTAEAVDKRKVDMKSVSLIAFLLAASSGSRPNARKLDKSDPHSGPHVLQRHRCVDEHDDGQVERVAASASSGGSGGGGFGWWQLERRKLVPRHRRFPMPRVATVSQWMPGVSATGSGLHARHLRKAFDAALGAFKLCSAGAGSGRGASVA